MRSARAIRPHCTDDLRESLWVNARMGYGALTSSDRSACRSDASRTSTVALAMCWIVIRRIFKARPPAFRTRLWQILGF